MMKTLQEVQRFFENDLKQKLAELEQRRLQVIRRYSFTTYRTTLKVLGVLDVVAIVSSMSLPESPLRWATMLIPFTAVVAIVYPIVLWILRASRFKAINRLYKREVIPQLLEFIQPGTKYYPEQGIPRREVDDSLLFERGYGTYHSEDLVEGSVDGVDIRFADAVLRQRLGSSGDNSVITIFSGLFFQLDARRQFSSNTIIEPDIQEGLTMKLAKKIFGDDASEVLKHIGRKMESLAGGLIDAGDARFDRYFSVFTHDEKETRSILTPSVMSKLADFREKLEYLVHISFTNHYLNIAIDSPDMFEGGVEESFLKFDNFRDYIEVLLLMFSLVEEIKMANARIQSTNHG